MEINYSSLIQKDVVCINTGKRFGRICDLIFTFPEGNVCGFLVPNKKCSLFSRGDIYIGLSNIKKIGDDVILVDLTSPPPRPKCICETEINNC